MNENIRITVANTEAKTLIASFGISTERADTLINTMTTMVDKGMSSEDPSKEIGIDDIIASLSELCETPAELGFITYALGHYLGSLQPCKHHKHEEKGHPLAGLGEILEEMFNGGRKKHPLEDILSGLDGAQHIHVGGRGVIIVSGRKRP